MQTHIHSIDNSYLNMIGASQAIGTVYQMIEQVAYSPSTVMITGETGTGKELVAQAIHAASPRKSNPMIKVNCAAIPANLVESELFGHERGSFTGAVERRIGKFEMANNGTLFLDEIGEIPMDIQAKLLRALQEREIERLGGKQTIKVNVRIIAATNRLLEKEVEEGRFRWDLYCRLNVFPISVPPLRDRREDIPLLADFFLEKYSRAFGKAIKAISAGAQRELLNYHWPGNVRELENTIERSALMASCNILKEVYLPKLVYKSTQTDVFRFKTIADNERDHIIQTLRQCGAKISGPRGAAEMLGVPVSTLTSKMSKLGISRDRLFLD
jgi:transcriptional regulator with GAF, ATPase, and Fis domain